MPHRGADLGADRIIDDCLACPYHGIRFASDGAATYRPATRRIPGLRRVEAWAAMFVDLKLFQRQDRAIFEGLDAGPSPLQHMALMPADRRAALWVRRWRGVIDNNPDGTIELLSIDLDIEPLRIET